ncbi:MAG TPA: TlpA disulfide reductase family protein [Candidatus Binataceae bacterium]|jgi:peroxiredoxin|nr:TlpA disulfide reductase family protein [Candidatus Binataceae bacterium]
MGRDAKLLSMIAGVTLLVALALVIYLQFGTAPIEQLTPDVANQVVPKTASGGTVAAGKMASNFQLASLDGQTMSLSSLRGKVVFLNVWATWCPPCREEMPSIEALYEKFKDDKNFVVLAVSQDSDGRAPVAAYVEQHGLKFDVLLDPQNKVGEAYDVSGIPETFIIDQNGRIVAHHVGPYDWANPEIRNALQELIKVKAS